MERLEYDSYGGSEVLRLRSFELPNPAENEVVVRVAAASINPMDWKIRNGEMKMFIGSKFPRALGTDFSGTVEAVGSKVTKFKPGDDVVGTVSMKISGAFAPKLITTEDLLVKKPNDLSFVQAACLPIPGATAWDVLVNKTGLKRNQKVFINGAAGAVGQAAVAIARAYDSEIVGRVGTKSMDQAKSLGLNSALNYNKPIPVSLHGMFDIVFDCNGSLSTKEQEQLTKKGGKIADIVPSPAKIIKSIIFRRSRKFVASNPKAENLQPVIDLAATGKFTIPIARTVSLSDASAVMDSLERGERLNGKVVIAF